MLPLPDLSSDQQRAVVLLIPFIAAGIAIFIAQPNKRILAGIFLASIWNFALLFPTNLMAISMGWWTFTGEKHLLLGLPFDVLLGWAVWWGAFLYLAFRGKHIWLALLAALWIDLLLMPRLSPLVTLGDKWLWGEVLVLTICFLPGWLVATFTAQDTRVGWRALAQAIMTGMLLIVLLPAVLLEYFDRTLSEIFQWSPWQLSLVINALLLPIILGLAASQEFAERGHGTPIPFDPPKRLVVTGPYSYVANPMQISIFLMLTVVAVAYQSWIIIGAALGAVIYNLGVVRWHHVIDMEPRFGDEWLEYKSHVREWIPRWKPWIREPSTVFFSRECNICQDVERWLLQQKAAGLHIEDAIRHPAPLDRVTYRYPDGSEVTGIYAIASCFNHLNFGFAFFGWFMRLPIIRPCLQLLIDGTGERAAVCRPQP